MTLAQEQFIEVMGIIGCFHSTNVKINMPVNGFVGNLGTTQCSIHITKCCAGLTKALFNAGYNISMDDNGMSVFRIG